MKRLFFRLLSVEAIAMICVIAPQTIAQTKSSETRSSFMSRLLPAEESSVPIIPVSISIRDNRLGEQHNLDLNLLEPALVDSLQERGYTVNSSLPSSRISSIEFAVQVSYFGTYKTLTGKLGIKAICALERKGKKNESVPITFDLLQNKKKLKGHEVTEAQLHLASQLSRRIADQVEEVVKQEGAAYRRVTARGCVPVKSEKGQSEVLQGAILDALRNVCEEAWGMKIEATTELVDIADVTDWAKKNFGCTILEYEVLKEFSSITSDGFNCVVVRAVTAKN